MAYSYDISFGEQCCMGNKDMGSYLCSSQAGCVEAQASLCKEVLNGTVADSTLGTGATHAAHGMVERGQHIVELAGIEAEAQLVVRSTVGRVTLTRAWSIVTVLTVGHDGSASTGRHHGTGHNVPLNDVAGLDSNGERGEQPVELIKKLKPGCP